MQLYRHIFFFMFHIILKLFNSFGNVLYVPGEFLGVDVWEAAPCPHVGEKEVNYTF